MRLEKLLKRKETYILTVGLIAVASIIAVNFTPYTIPALKSIVLDTPNDCTTINKGEVQIVAVPGSGMTMDPEGNLNPDYMMQIRLQAAKNHIDNFDNNVISVGLLDGTSDPNGKKFNKDFLLSLNPKISSEKIWSENISINTPENTDRVVEQVGLEHKIAFISNFEHLPRVLFYACVKGLKAQGFVAEDLAGIVRIKNTNLFNNEKIWLLIAALFDKSGFWATQYQLLIQS